LNNLIKVTVT